MTNKLQLFSSQIAKALSYKDFELLFTLFTSNKFSFTEILIFYKQRNNSKLPFREQLFSFKEFWTSQLPHFHLEGIMESDLKVNFLQAYLSSNENCNHELNSHLMAIAKSDCIKFFKLWSIFELPKFFESLKQLSKSDSELERIVKEFEVIIKVQRKIAAEEKEDENYFLQFTLGEIVLAFTLYYYELKQQDQVAGNKSWQTKIEMTLVDELNNIISLFKGKPNMNFQFSNNEELQKNFRINEAPHHILGKKGLVVPLEAQFNLLYRLINRLIDRNSRKGQIQLYLSRFSDFRSVILNPAPLQTNGSYVTFKINDAKSTPEELYFSKLRMESIRNGEIVSKTDITSSIENLKFYGIPETVKHKDYIIEIKKALHLLKCFSVFKGTVERGFLPGGKFIIYNQGDNLFRELFGTNESITLFDYDTLRKKISKYFKWTESEASALLSFLTLDVTTKSFPDSWVNSPFIKCGNQVFWLGSFLKDRRWDNILLNKLKTDFEYKKLINTFSKNFELRIEEVFKTKSFKTISGINFKSSNGQTGDFDVLAFKDNHLFVCEAKTGIRSNEFIHAAKSETVRLEGCAADQLEKAILNIREDWTNIKVKLGVDDKIELASVKIIPLIVTDYFEGDLQLYKNSIRKTSLLEIEVILKNKKKDLLQLYEFTKSTTDSLNPNLKQKSTVISNWDLWGGKKEFETDMLIQNIDQNSIWKEIETIWNFDDEHYAMNY